MIRPSKQFAATRHIDYPSCLTAPRRMGGPQADRCTQCYLPTDLYAEIRKTFADCFNGLSRVHNGHLVSSADASK